MQREPPGDRATAPSYHVPQRRIVSIEHPCVVKNFDNAFKSLGGEHQLKRVLEPQIGGDKKDGTEHIVGVSLRPDDPFSKKLPSTVVPTQDVLLKVTVPKRTGRKRKRGSGEPFTESSPPDGTNVSITGSDLLQRLRDNADSYTIQAVGTIQDTHRFQSLPDLQLQAGDVPIMRNLRDHAMHPDYETLKDFRPDLQANPDGQAIFPGPPSFIPNVTPYQYKPSQPSTADTVQPPTKKNISRKKGLSMVELGISLETSAVPQGPPRSLGEPSGKTTPTTVSALKAVFSHRPIVTLRAFEAMNPTLTRKSIAIAIQYAGYYINDGPWTGTIVAFGVDPRTDPNHRFYQTLAYGFRDIERIRIMLKQRQPEGLPHIFDGEHLSDFHRNWQLCDLIDPALQELVNSTETRTEDPDPKTGWYFNGTMAKLRVLTRHKMIRIINGEPQLSDEEFKALSGLPDKIAHAIECRLELKYEYLQPLANEIAREAVQGWNKFDRILKRRRPGDGQPRLRRPRLAAQTRVDDVEQEIETPRDGDSDDFDELDESEAEEDESTQID